MSAGICEALIVPGSKGADHMLPLFSCLRRGGTKPHAQSRYIGTLWEKMTALYDDET